MLDSGIKDRLELLKAQRVEEILNDDSLSKIDKLRTIEEEKLWDYSRFIQDEFASFNGCEWQNEAIELEKKEAERLLELGVGDDICAKMFYQSKMTDSIFDPSLFIYEKYEIVSYARALELAHENHLCEVNSEEFDENPLMTVITTRHPYTELKKNYLDIVDVVFNFAVKNKIVGFKNDW